MNKTYGNDSTAALGRKLPTTKKTAAKPLTTKQKMMIGIAVAGCLIVVLFILDGHFKTNKNARPRVFEVGILGSIATFLIAILLVILIMAATFLLDDS